jgi:hypothetical protein
MARNPAVRSSMQPQPSGGVGGLQGEGQRRVARAGAQHDISHAPARQLVDDDLGLCC